MKKATITKKVKKARFTWSSGPKKVGGARGGMTCIGW